MGNSLTFAYNGQTDGVSIFISIESNDAIHNIIEKTIDINIYMNIYICIYIYVCGRANTLPGLLDCIAATMQGEKEAGLNEICLE